MMVDVFIPGGIAFDVCLAGFGAGLPSATEAQVLVADAAGVYQSVTLSGDATIVASGALTLANSGVVAGAYSFPDITVDAKGRITAAASNALAAGEIWIGTPPTARLVSGDATLAASGALSLATVNANVGAFTNASITVNAKGLVTAAASGSAPNTGAGTANFVTKYTGANTQGNSQIFDDGTNAGINKSAGLAARLTVKGASGGNVLRLVNDLDADLLLVRNDGSFFIGQGASTNFSSQIAIGQNANAASASSNNIAIGNAAVANFGVSSISIGSGAIAGTTNCLAIGTGANNSSSAVGSVAIGLSAANSLRDAVAILGTTNVEGAVAISGFYAGLSEGGLAILCNMSSTKLVGGAPYQAIGIGNVKNGNVKLLIDKNTSVLLNNQTTIQIGVDYLGGTANTIAIKNGDTPAAINVTTVTANASPNAAFNNIGSVLSNGDKVVNSGFANPGYNGTFYVKIRVSGLANLSVNRTLSPLIAFAGDDSGTMTPQLRNPDAAITDGIQIHSKDSSDAAATLSLFLEQAVEPLGVFVPSHKIKVWINGVEYWLELDAV